MYVLHKQKSVIVKQFRFHAKDIKIIVNIFTKCIRIEIVTHAHTRATTHMQASTA